MEMSWKINVEKEGAPCILYRCCTVLLLFTRDKTSTNEVIFSSSVVG